MFLSQRVGAALCCAALIFSACTNGDDVAAGGSAQNDSTEIDDSASPGSSSTSPPSAPPTTAPPTTPPPSSDTTSDATSDTSVPSTAPIDDDLVRLAPAGPEPFEVFFWTPDSISLRGATSTTTRITDGPYFEVVDVPLAGIAYQRTWDADTIWIIDSADGPRELLVAAPGQTLTLEGAGVNDLDEPVVFYQRRIGGSPEDSISTLRRYNLETEAVDELIVTGGWESGTGFSTLQQGIAVGNNGAEGWEWTTLIDLESGEETYNTDVAGISCGDDDGDRLCPAFEVSTLVNGVVYGFDQIWNESTQAVDQYGLIRFDPATGAIEIIQGFPWDNGTWYPEDIFVLGDQLVVSVTDIDREPLPGLVYDLSTGDFWSLPEAAFVRPAFIS